MEENVVGIIVSGKGQSCIPSRDTLIECLRELARKNREEEDLNSCWVLHFQPQTHTKQQSQGKKQALRFQGKLVPAQASDSKQDVVELPTSLPKKLEGKLFQFSDFHLHLRVVVANAAKRKAREDSSESKRRQKTIEDEVRRAQDTGIISLKKKGLTDSDMRHLREVCTSVSTPFKQVLVRGNKISDSGAEELVQLVECCHSISRVDLSENRRVSLKTLSTIHGKTGINTLRIGQTEMNALRSLNECQLGDHGAILVANWLADPLRDEERRSFPVIGLAKNKIGQDGAIALAEMMSRDTNCVRSIRLLEVYSNEPTSMWASAFARMLKVNSTLTSLDLGRNGLYDNDCLPLADALCSNAVLEELHLDYNHITDTGCKLLLEAVPKSALHSLWLHGNQVTDETHDNVERELSLNRRKLVPLPTETTVKDELRRRITRMSRLSVDKSRTLVSSPMLSPQWADALAYLCINHYLKICPDHASSVLGQFVLACFVMQVNDTLEVVSMGGGTRFVDGWLLRHDTEQERVKDSHAEVIARRNLSRFLHAQTQIDADKSILVRLPSGKWTLCPGISFHLYTSTAPCGAASSLSLSPDVTWGKGGGSTCTSWTSTQRKSCTDKIKRWLKHGLQPKGMRDRLESVVGLESVVIGRRWSTRCEETFPNAVATSVLLEEYLPQKCSASKRGDSDLCISWSLGDEGPETYDGKTGLCLDHKSPQIAPIVLRMTSKMY